MLLSIITISLAFGCVNIQTPSKSQTTPANIVLIQDREMTLLNNGEMFTTPNDVEGVKYWILISDFAFQKMNEIKIELTR